MATLFLDEGILADPTKWAQNKEVFEKAIQSYIESHYKGEDSASVYALFTPEQIEVLQWYYKGYSIEEYRSLAGTVDLQVKARNEKVKKKIDALCTFMDIPKSEIADWEYDGMVDAGPDANFKCDLCPRPVRYAHYAVNKKTHECLRFGCNCAADFFSIEANSFNALKTVQAKTLKDLKIIACVLEKDIFNDYYKYMCGYVGRVYLEGGIEALRDLMTFSLEWDEDKKRIVGDTAHDSYPVKYGDGHTENKPLEWIKTHIVSCTNADLDEDMYNELSIRSLVYVDNKELSDKQVNNSFFITYAIKCLEVGLPVPLSICQKINQITAKVSKQHHPDYLKYVEELLLQRNLANNSLLRTAFREFIVNYLASSMNIADRDPELACWGIRGQKTFYNTVLNWEAMLAKLMTIKQIDDMRESGLILDDEWRTSCRYPGNVKPTVLKYAYQIDPYVKKAEKLFLSDGEVIKDNKEMNNGFSKYSLKGNPTKIELDVSKLGYDVKSVNPNYKPTNSEFTPDLIPYSIGLAYLAYQQGFKTIVSQSIKYVYDFTGAVLEFDNDDDIIRFLCALKGSITDAKNVVHLFSNWYRYSYRKYSKSDLLLRLKDIDNLEMVKEVKKVYADRIPEFKNDCKILHDSLSEIMLGVMNIKFEYLKKSDINDDYDDIINKTEKTAHDYFLEYINLLIADRNDDIIKQYIKKNSIVDICAFKVTNKYADMMNGIIDIYRNQKRASEEKRVYEVMNLDMFKTLFKPIIDLNNIDFMKLLLIGWAKAEYKNKLYNSNITTSSVSSILTRLENAMSKEIKERAKEELLVYTDTLFDNLKKLYNSIDKTLTFESYLDLLDIDVDYAKQQLKSVTTAEGYRGLLSQEFNVPKFEIHTFANLQEYFQSISYYKNFKEAYADLSHTFSEFYDKIFAELERIERENALRDKLVRETEIVLNEHIKFFEVNIDEAKRYNPSYNSKKDDAIRRSEAFRTVSFEKGNPLVKRLIVELEKYGSQNWSECVDKAVMEVKSQLNSGMDVEKKYFDILPAELYGKKLIFNHFEVLHKVLLDLKKLDFKVLDINDLETIYNVLKVYYIFKTDCDKLIAVLNKNGGLSFDFDSEYAQISTEGLRTAKEAYESYFEKPDSTGLTGVEKAGMVYNHSDFNNLDDFLKKLVKGVAIYKKCSKKQLVYVNKAYEQLGLGKTDPVDIEDSENKDGEDDAKSLCELAFTIQSHNDFNTLPTWLKGIINTLAMNYKQGKYSCSVNQKKYLLQAQKKLGL